MKETFDYGYASTALKDFMDSFQKSEEFGAFGISIEGGFSQFNLRDGFNLQSRISQDPYNPDTVALQELVAKQCLMKKTVTCLIDGESAGGSFVITDQGNMFEAYPVINENPGLYAFILNTCTAHVLKKFMPPRKLGQPAPKPEAAKG